ncbi:MAG TPA: hypothetical protein PLA50_04815, partial [Bacteroidia bacterium]|nr:hypothetical protein [Bacteroidia bacterium]
KTEPGYDELHLATLWLLSPPGADRAKFPSAEWSPHVQHRCWWNLNYAAARKGVHTEPSRIPLPPMGLAGGAGDALILGYVDSMEFLESEAAAQLNQSYVRGRFWSV